MTIKFSKILNFWSRSKLLITIFITLAALMIASALIELSQSKKELYDLMEDQAESLINSILVSSQNSLFTNDQLTSLIEERLLNNAALIRNLFNSNNISNKRLNDICNENNLFRINIFDNAGNKLFYSHGQTHFSTGEKYTPKQLYNPIFTGYVDTLIIGLIPARFEEGNRFAVAVSGKYNSAIVINIDADKLLSFRRTIGFGPQLRNIVSGNPSIIFAALQNTTTIMAASGIISSLESIQSSEFLSTSLADTSFASRITTNDSLDVFEVVHPFDYNNHQIGLLRLGLSMEPIHEINNRIVRRLWIITLVLFIIGSIIFAMIFALQRLGILRKQFTTVETYSSNIINNASDAILVYNNNDGIKIYNQSAEVLFGKKDSTILGKGILELFNANELDIINGSKLSSIQLVSKINGIDKFLLISKTIFIDDNGIPNTILLLSDLTQQKRIEEQMERNQRLSAMGELASGVAHEIRNPLNTISTIVQQLDKDFTPKENDVEYHELSNIVYKEVNRINQTIQDFLLFAKPEEISPMLFKLDKLLKEIETQYKALLSKRDITLKIDQKWKGSVNWDFNKMKQVFLNLIDNAIDSIKDNGVISINVEKINNTIILEIKDNGSGIPKSLQSKIFNLYYTTKAKGTGIGLSIVQRIVFAHKGTIRIDDKYVNGTSFIVSLPILKHK